MQITLKFNFPVDEDIFYATMNARAMRDALVEIQKYLRRKLKYENLQTITARELLEDIKEKLANELEDGGISCIR